MSSPFGTMAYKYTRNVPSLSLPCPLSMSTTQQQQPQPQLPKRLLDGSTAGEPPATRQKTSEDDLRGAGFYRMVLHDIHPFHPQRMFFYVCRIIWQSLTMSNWYSVCSANGFEEIDSENGPSFYMTIHRDVWARIPFNPIVRARLGTVLPYLDIHLGPWLMKNRLMLVQVNTLALHAVTCDSYATLADLPPRLALVWPFNGGQNNNVSAVPRDDFLNSPILEFYRRQPGSFTGRPITDEPASEFTVAKFRLRTDISFPPSVSSIPCSCKNSLLQL